MYKIAALFVCFFSVFSLSAHYTGLPHTHKLPLNNPHRNIFVCSIIDPIKNHPQIDCEEPTEEVDDHVHRGAIRCKIVDGKVVCK
jgi:hypothetical protein